MSLEYKDINISINGSNILAQSVGFNQTSPQKPIFNLNNRASYTNVPTNLLNSVSIEYLLEPGIETVYPIIVGLIQDKSFAIPSLINLGDIYFTGYLNQYSLQLSPNATIKIKSNFDIFNPITGNLSAQYSGDSLLYDSGNSYGIANYWSAQFQSNRQKVNADILQLNYSVAITQSPIYSIGDYQPKQIYIKDITESLEIITEGQANITYSGSFFNNIFNNVQYLVLSGASSSTINLIDYGHVNAGASSFLDWGYINMSYSNSLDFGYIKYYNTPYPYLSIPMAGFIFEGITADIKTNDILLFDMKFNRYN